MASYKIVQVIEITLRIEATSDAEALEIAERYANEYTLADYVDAAHDVSYGETKIA